MSLRSESDTSSFLFKKLKPIVSSENDQQIHERVKCTVQLNGMA